MSDSESEGNNEGVIVGRKIELCPRLQSFSQEDLIETCPHCDQFFLFCCPCSQRYDDYEARKPCHHYRLVFTDGACRQNGQMGATAGIGISCGESDGWQQSIPVTASLDPGQKRTSQRAELLAALAGLKYMVRADELNESGEETQDGVRGPESSRKAWIIATDSEYVVKGMTEWLPTWKVRF